MWKIGKTIGDKEGRMDTCIAAAGVLKTHTNCLEYPASQFRQVCDFHRTLYRRIDQRFPL